jgi:hypothetical protein
MNRLWLNVWRSAIAVLMAAWTVPAAAADPAWYRSSCMKDVEAAAIGPCLRGSGMLTVARRLAILKDAKARLIGPQGKDVLESLQWGAIVEEPALRKAIGEVLVEAKVLSRESAARIPGPSEVVRAARDLVARSPKSEVKQEQVKRLDATAFRVAGENKPGTLTIIASGRAGCRDCFTVRVYLTLSKGPGGWRLEAASLGGSDDGTCGCCKLDL